MADKDTDKTEDYDRFEDAARRLLTMPPEQVDKTVAESPEPSDLDETDTDTTA